LNASDWWQSLWEKLPSIQSRPFLIFWGMKDRAVPPRELEKWRLKLPAAQIKTFDDAGHFVQEEKPEEMARAIRHFLSYPVVQA
jgi:haloalkane dehalogenase